MKLFFLLVSFVSFSAIAQAANSTKIGQLPDYSDISTDSVTYKVNASLGRAELDLVFVSHGFETGGDDDSSSPYYEDNYLVPGLSYDAASSQVIYTEANGSVTICANQTTKSGLFGSKVVYQATGLCEVSLQSETQVSDDGFNQTSSTDTAILFNIQ